MGFLRCVVHMHDAGSAGSVPVPRTLDNAAPYITKLILPCIYRDFWSWCYTSAGNKAPLGAGLAKLKGGRNACGQAVPARESRDGAKHGKPATSNQTQLQPRPCTAAAIRAQLQLQRVPAWFLQVLVLTMESRTSISADFCRLWCGPISSEQN